MASTPGFEPGPQWWEASALTTAPPLLPLMHKEMIDIEKINISINVTKNFHFSKKLTYSQACLKISFKAWLPGLCIIICRLFFVNL